MLLADPSDQRMFNNNSFLICFANNTTSVMDQTSPPNPPGLLAPQLLQSDYLPYKNASIHYFPNTTEDQSTNFQAFPLK